MSYSLKFTSLAQAVAERHGMNEVRAQIHKELDGLLESGLPHVDKLMFHTVAMGSYFDDTVPQFLVTPLGDGVMKVECATQEESDDPLTDGPFKGKKVSIPHGEEESS